MEIFSLPGTPGEIDITSILKLGPLNNATIDVGSACFPTGIRFPESDYSIHEQHEVSVLLQGELLLETPHRSARVKAGQIIHLTPGEQHAATAIAETQVFYVLYGKPAESA